MSNKLLDIYPLDLKFHFELKKYISCTQYLTNKTDNYVAFKVKTTNPKRYCVRPNIGVVLPGSSIEVVVIMQAQKEVPADMQCKDKFLFQCFVASPGSIATEITTEMFSKESGNQVENIKLRVVYVDPPRPPLKEGSLPRASVSDNGNASASAVITRLTEEKNSAVQLNKKLQQELDQLKQGSNKSQSGCGIDKSQRGCGLLIHIKWYISARVLRRKTVKEGEVAIQI
ncbi:vesicle-associated protein 1-2-like [Raphanus sativus]|uniref:Vesicle-associated protein 1-2-like n=1 Tax=Raphanus sativus TaxID=3726 RepID=A0A6J0MXN8_RAPSA|nr:vesicle-associated protein 1-2-like [Raphanus sativus]